MRNQKVNTKEEVSKKSTTAVEKKTEGKKTKAKGTGRTTVVRKIVNSLAPGEVVLLPQDSYYKDSSHVPAELRQQINFDHPDAFDWPLLLQHIQMLKEGKSIEQPVSPSPRVPKR